MKSVLLVGCGGFAGAVLRYLACHFTQHWSKSLPMPVGTLSVNVLGCALIGVLMGVSQRADWFTESTRLVLVVGLLGGFTTYSAFGFEAVELLRDKGIGWAMLYIGIHIFLGIGATFLAYGLSGGR